MINGKSLRHSYSPLVLSMSSSLVSLTFSVYLPLSLALPILPCTFFTSLLSLFLSQHWFDSVVPSLLWRHHARPPLSSRNEFAVNSSWRSWTNFRCHTGERALRAEEIQYDHHTAPAIKQFIAFPIAVFDDSSPVRLRVLKNSVHKITTFNETEVWAGCDALADCLFFQMLQFFRL